jgi:transcriptional regulator GlxA family with amidase domain
MTSLLPMAVLENPVGCSNHLLSAATQAAKTMRGTELTTNELPFVNTCLKQIQDWCQLAEDSHWRVSELAKKCSVSPRTLQRYFLKQMGKSPKDWLLEHRYRRAVELLTKGKSVKETAIHVGYGHSNSFSRQFKKYWGTQPTSSERPITFS